MLKNKEALRWVAQAINTNYWLPEFTVIHIRNNLAIGSDRRRTHIAKVQNIANGFYDAKTLQCLDPNGDYPGIMPVESQTYHPLLPSQNPFNLFTDVAISNKHLRQALAFQFDYRLLTDGTNIKGYLAFGWFYIFGKKIR